MILGSQKLLPTQSCFGWKQNFVPHSKPETPCPHNNTKKSKVNTAYKREAKHKTQIPNMSVEFTSQAILRLEEAKQILMEIESTQTVDLPRLEKEKLELQDNIQRRKLEWEEICTQVDKANEDLQLLNRAIQTVQQQKMEEESRSSSSSPLAESQQQPDMVEPENSDGSVCENANLDCDMTSVENQSNRSFPLLSDDDESQEAIREITIDSKGTNCLNEETTCDDDSTSSILSLSTPSTAHKKKVHLRRHSTQSYPKKWRRMIRTNRLRSVLLLAK